MPNEGDEVKFCLAFHWTGPCAWYVVCQPGVVKAQKAIARSVMSFAEEEDSDSDTSDKGDEESLLPLVGESLHTQTVRPRQKSAVVEDSEVHQWGHYLDSTSEKQGIIFQVFPSNGYGWIHHPNFKDLLFFHAKQIVPPVDSLSSIEVYSVVSFIVGKSERGPRAMNIETVEEENINSQLRKCREELLKEEEKKKSSTASAAPRRAVRTVKLPNTLEDFYLMGSRQEGHICDLRAPPKHKSVDGYIEVPSSQERLFFNESLSGIPKRENS
ncbi:hypothetical protein OS493_005418 [Desmophyllum pertusum]|uniref:Uncharacterized protein n=1 Tax=Desmophyllum pertusum TaxID=174260 RepID=A0A9W9YTK8_9CNID|nr:hypothetical protein OS493_005418 [Desmophyllum pertusum]